MTALALSRLRPAATGRCPGAFYPMRSGDGLLLRVRPYTARLHPAQITGLAEIAEQFGNGHLQLTNRANLQIRAVADSDIDNVRAGLDALGLLDTDPGVEARRNILVQPFWQPGDRTERLARALLNALPHLPDLSPKFGFAVDEGPNPLMGRDPADIRLERSDSGELLLRPDNWPTGTIVTEAQAIPAAVDLAKWFAATRRTGVRRMAVHLAQSDLPARWSGAIPAPPAARPAPGRHSQGWIIGAAFGDLPARELARLVRNAGAESVTLTPWRLVLLNGANQIKTGSFVTRANDPILYANACVGAPSCPASSVATRDLARRLAKDCPTGLHVSGCAKGCACPRPAPVTLVGRAGTFNLVRNGAAWDEPEVLGLDPENPTLPKGTPPDYAL